MHVFLNFIILGSPLPRPHPNHLSKLNFTEEILHFTTQINAYQEGTKIDTEVNERPLKNIGTHWNIRHRWFQRVPISFSLAELFHMRARLQSSAGNQSYGHNCLGKQSNTVNRSIANEREILRSATRHILETTQCLPANRLHAYYWYKGLPWKLTAPRITANQPRTFLVLLYLDFWLCPT